LQGCNEINWDIHMRPPGGRHLILGGRNLAEAHPRTCKDYDHHQPDVQEWCLTHNAASMDEGRRGPTTTIWMDRTESLAGRASFLGFDGSMIQEPHECVHCLMAMQNQSWERGVGVRRVDTKRRPGSSGDRRHYWDSSEPDYVNVY
jgi:hypothetical protein